MNREPDIYQDARGRVWVGPGAVLARREDEARAHPIYADETVLVRALEYAVIDGDEDRRKRIESAIMRARLARASEPTARPIPAGARREDYAATAFEDIDAKAEPYGPTFNTMQHNGNRGR